MLRPAVDVVVPFRGSGAELEDLVVRVGRLRLRPGDTMVVVDNTPAPRRAPGSETGAAAPLRADHRPGQATVVRATERSTPAFARNRGAALGRAEWLVFFDADTDPSEDLLDRYFDPPPGPRTALLGGGVTDEAVRADAPPAPRYTYLRRAMSQDDTFRFGRWSFPKTANLACRREAFDAVGGFREDIRGGEDADLTYRLRAAGWELERRESAAVVHLSRQTVLGFIAQKAVHGGGMAWLNRTYPGSWPPRRRPGLVWWGLRTSTMGLISAAVRRDRDAAIWALFEPLELLAFEFGRSLPNRRPLPAPWNRVRPSAHRGPRSAARNAIAGRG